MRGNDSITDEQIMVTRPCEVWVEFSLPAVQTFLPGGCSAGLLSWSCKMGGGGWDERTFRVCLLPPTIPSQSLFSLTPTAYDFFFSLRKLLLSLTQLKYGNACC